MSLFSVVFTGHFLLKCFWLVAVRSLMVVPTPSACFMVVCFFYSTFYGEVRMAGSSSFMSEGEVRTLGSDILLYV